MTIFSAIIVEDSRLARLELRELLKVHSYIKIIDEASHVDEGVQKINKQRPDIIFLDINMPEKDGFELLQALDNLPLVVFTTAYDQYAVKAFEHHAFDYLLKPISQKRFDQTIDKVLPLLTSRQTDKHNKKLNEDNQIFIKEGDDCWMVSLQQITMFEIMGNYTRVFFDDNKPLIYKSLNQVESNLPDDVFFRANRQQIINLKHINNIESWFKGSLKAYLSNGVTVDISRRQSQKFKQMLEL